MAPRSLGYRQVQQRMRRSLNYGSRRMRSLSLPLSEMLVDYFDKYAPYDYMDMNFATSLARESCVDACTFLVAMVYMDRMRTTDKLHFETSDPAELYLSALVVASKYLHDGGLDEFVYNDEWAASAGASLKRVNELELKLLDLLSWNVNVDDAQFSKVLGNAEHWVARETMRKQGFCTYNEATVLSEDTKFLFETLKSMLSILAALTLLYSAFVASILIVPRLTAGSTKPCNASIQKIVRPKHALLRYGVPTVQSVDLSDLALDFFELRKLWWSESESGPESESSMESEIGANAIINAQNPLGKQRMSLDSLGHFDRLDYTLGSMGLKWWWQNAPVMRNWLNGSETLIDSQAVGALVSCNFV